MPDINVQDEQGVTHVFPNEATPEMIAKVMGVKPPSDEYTQQTQAAAKAGGSTIAPVPGSKPERSGVSAAPPPITGGKMMKKGLFGEDISAEGEENIGRARAAFEKVPSSVARPLSAVEGARGLAELPGAVTGLAKRGISALRRFSYEPPEKISLGPLGKINRNVPPNPYEEMGASAQYRDVARDAMKPPAKVAPSPSSYFPGATTSSNAPGNAGPDMMMRGGENWYQPPIPEDVPPVPGTSARTGPVPRYGPPAPTADPWAEKLPLPQRAHAEMAADLAKRAEAPAPLPMRAHAEMTADIQAAQQERAAAQAAMDQDIGAGRQVRAGARSEMYGDLAAARNARTEEIAPANAALTRNPAPIAPRANPPAWKTAQAPEAPIPAPARPPVQKVPEPPWITRAAQKAQGGFEGAPAVESPVTRPGTPRTAIPEERPTSTEEFLTNLVKKPIWTPEDSVDVRNAFGRDGLMRPGEGQTQYRARLMGMIRSSRAAQGMTDIESYPAPKRPR